MPRLYTFIKVEVDLPELLAYFLTQAGVLDAEPPFLYLSFALSLAILSISAPDNLPALYLADISFISFLLF